MASFTDSPELLTRFNPYVQQAPTEALVSVGVELQRRYDEGVQKIQSSIDRVAGLDIARDVDKKYLQSKLNELGTRLRTVAAGDFSNYQLTNHVAGMASSVGKDENIITAVKSTAWYRKQAEQMEKDNTAGKGNPANNARFNKRANAWFSSTELGKSFSDSYIPPVDVWAKVKDIADKVGIDSQDIQQLYQTDEQGNIVYEEIKDPKTGEIKKGGPKWNPIMVEKVLKGKDAGKILSALESSLTSADYQQLAIEGEYMKSSYTPEMLKEEININFKEQSDFYNDKIQAIKIDLLRETEKNDKDVERITSLENQLKYFNTAIERSEVSRDRNLKLADSDPDSVRGSLYTNSYLHKMSKELSSQDVSIKYSVSPMHTITMDQNKFDLEIRKYNTSVDQWQIEENRRERELQHKIDMDNAQLKTDGVGGEFYDLPLPAYPTAAKEFIEERYNSSVQRGNDLDRILAIASYKKSRYSRNPGESDKAYDARVLGELTRDGGNDPQGYISRVASIYTKGGNIPAEFIDIVKERDFITKENEVIKRQIEKVKSEALAEATAQGIKIKSDDDILKSTGVKGKYVKVNDEQIYLSPRDLLNFAYAAPGIIKSKVRKEKQEAAKKELVERFGLNYQKVAKQIYEYIGVQGNPVFYEIADEDVYKISNEIDYDQYNEVSKIESEKYQEYGYVPQGRKIPVKRAKENREDFNSEISALIRVYDGDVGRKGQLKEAQKAFLADPNATVSIDAIPSGMGSKYELVVSSDKAGKEYRVGIDDAAYTTLMKSAPISMESKPAIVSMLELSNNTNLGKAEDPETAWFKESDFKGLKNYKARADYITSEGNPNMVWMKIYLYDEKGNFIDNLTFPDPNYTDVRLTLYDRDKGIYNRTLDSYPATFTDEIINQMRKKKE